MLQFKKTKNRMGKKNKGIVKMQEIRSTYSNIIIKEVGQVSFPQQAGECGLYHNQMELKENIFFGVKNLARS